MFTSGQIEGSSILNRAKYESPTRHVKRENENPEDRNSTYVSYRNGPPQPPSAPLGLHADDVNSIAGGNRPPVLPHYLLPRYNVGHDQKEGHIAAAAAPVVIPRADADADEEEDGEEEEEEERVQSKGHCITFLDFFVGLCTISLVMASLYLFLYLPQFNLDRKSKEIEKVLSVIDTNLIGRSDFDEIVTVNIEQHNQEVIQSLKEATAENCDAPSSDAIVNCDAPSTIKKRDSVNTLTSIIERQQEVDACVLRKSKREEEKRKEVTNCLNRESRKMKDIKDMFIDITSGNLKQLLLSNATFVGKELAKVWERSKLIFLMKMPKEKELAIARIEGDYDKLTPWTQIELVVDRLLGWSAKATGAKATIGHYIPPIIISLFGCSIVNTMKNILSVIGWIFDVLRACRRRQ